MLACALGCSPAAAVAPDELVVLLPDGPQTLDPRFATDAYSVKITRLIDAGLATIDPTALDAVPDLAASIAEPRPGLYRVRLRGGLSFSDGSPIEAEDVLATYRSLMDPALGSPYGRTYRQIARMEALDALTIEFDLGGPHAPFWTDLEVPILPRSMEHRRGGGQGERRVGAGPYRLVRFGPGEVVLAPNPRSHRPPIAPHRVALRVVHDDTSRLLRLLGQGADAAQNAVPHYMIDALARRSDFRVIESTGSGLTVLGLNVRKGPLASVEVRRAIAHALDRPLLLTTRLAGHGLLASGFLSPRHWAHSDELPRYDHDTDRARALLDAAGFPSPSGGGPRFVLRLTTTTLRTSIAHARAIAAMLEPAGIEVELRPLERGTFFDDLKRGRFEMTILTIPDIVQPHLMHWFFASESVPTREALDAGANRWGYRSAELDLLLEQGRATERRDLRRRIYAEAQKVLARDLPVIPLWHENVVAIAGRRVQGLRVRPDARFDGLVGTSLSRR